jgi:hypothetical protein
MNPALVTMFRRFLPIEVINAVADTGATDEASAGSFSVSSGQNRALVAIQHANGSTDDTTGLAWGGEAMTLRQTAISLGGFPARVRIWTLGESGIAAAVGTGFSVTGSANGIYRCTAVALANVNQASPIVDSGIGLESGGNPADVVLSTEPGGYAIAGLTFDHASTNVVSWGADLTKRLDLESSATGVTWSVADALTDGSNVTADPTTNDSTNQQCQAAISLRAA